MFCVACFRNQGLREEAGRIAQANDGSACPNCGSFEARLVTREQVDALIERFFVHGSTAPTGQPEPIYKHSQEALSDEGGLHFDRTLRDDYALLSRHDSGTLFLHAPRTWRLGYTTIDEQLTEAFKTPGQDGISTARKFLDEVIDHCEIVEVPTGTLVYRVRCNVERPFEISEFDPPLEVTKSRFSDGSIPVLYAAFDAETCLHEGRVRVDDKITMATLQPTRDLRVLDLTNVPYDFQESGEGGNIFYFANSKLVFGSHSQTGRRLGVRCQEWGLDGIKYPSYFSNVRPSCQRVPNIAIFGRPLQDRLLRIHSINNVRIDTIQYEFTYGPVTQAPSQDDFRDLQALVEQDWSGRNPRDIVAEIKKILARSDPPD